MSEHRNAAKRGTGARERATALALALVLSLAAAIPLVAGPGMANTRAGGDSAFLLQRVQQLTENLRAGVFPARWMADGAQGLGYPFYVFYGALPYYLAAALNLLGLGVVRSIQAAQVAGFLLAGMGAYGLARRLGAGRPAALLATAAYTYAPFHLVNVYVRGDSLSEFFAMGLFPWLLWAALEVVRRQDAGSVAWLGGGYGLLVLTHNISALVFSPFLAIWMLAAAIWPVQRRPWRAVGLCAAAIGLGLLLSAWFWVPALREQPLVQLQDQTTGYFHYPGHFRSTDLVQGNLIHDYTIDAARNPFSMGQIQAGLAVLALGLVAFRARRERRLGWHRVVLLAGVLGYTFLITPWSRAIWDHVPLLPYAQFPWRMLSIQALGIALLAADGAGAIVRRGPRAAAAAALAALCVVGGMAGLRVDRLPIGEEEITAERAMLYESYSGNIGTTIRHEYLPAEMVPRPQVSTRQLDGAERAAPLALEGSLASARLASAQPEAEVWELDVATPALLAFQTAFYPGWQAMVDGAAVGVQPLEGLGLIGLRLPAGPHRVELRYAGTRTQRYSRWASLAGLFALLGLALWEARRPGRNRRRAGAVLGAGVLLGIGLALAARTPIAARMPIAARTPGAARMPVAAAESDIGGPLVMDFGRVPWLHGEPQGLRFGEALLTGYSYASEKPVPGGDWTVDLTWGAAPVGLTVEVTLASATAHLYAPSPTWASARAALSGPRQALTLVLPEDLPPGLYVPSLRVFRGDEELPAFTGAGASMGTPALAPVTVGAHRASDGAEEPLGAYGPEQMPPVVALLGADLYAAGANRVEAVLTWRSERQAPLNYMLSLRLQAPDGAALTSRDLPPFLGAYPTSLWQPGEVLTDRVLLEVPADVPAEGLRLEVVLYDRLTLKGAGSVTVPGLALQDPR